MSREKQPRVVVVGAGPGGLAAVGRLRARAGDRVEVVLAAPGGSATFLPGTLDVALGDAEPDRFDAALSLEGVSPLDGVVDAVAPDGVVVGGERIAADAVIAAPGLALADGVGAEWSRAVAAWDPAGAVRARAHLPDVSAGRVVVATCSLPYRCPPAPFALAIRLAERYFKARRMNRVTVVTPEAMPLAGVGGDAPAFLMEACAAAGVVVERGFAVDLEASSDGLLRASDGRELTYDAAFLVPPHVRPACLSGLPGDGPLVPVGPRCAVDDTSLYVVGDAAATGLPRAAGVARGTAVLAADGALEALGVAPAPAPEAIEASCFLDHFGGAVSRIRVRFEGVSGGGDLAGPGDPGNPAGPGGFETRVQIDGPSLDLDHAREGERQRFIAAAQGRELAG